MNIFTGVAGTGVFQHPDQRNNGMDGLVDKMLYAAGVQPVSHGTAGNLLGCARRDDTQLGFCLRQGFLRIQPLLQQAHIVEYEAHLGCAVQVFQKKRVKDMGWHNSREMQSKKKTRLTR